MTRPVEGTAAAAADEMKGEMKWGGLYFNVLWCVLLILLLLLNVFHVVDVLLSSDIFIICVCV